MLNCATPQRPRNTHALYASWYSTIPSYQSHVVTSSVRSVYYNGSGITTVVPIAASHCATLICARRWGSAPKSWIWRSIVNSVSYSANVLHTLEVRLIDFTWFAGEHGCRKHMRLEHLRSHVSRCDYNPANAAAPCQSGCGAQLRPADIPAHNCVRHLKSEIESLKQTQVQLVQQAQDFEAACHRLERLGEQRDRFLQDLLNTLQGLLE